VKRKMSLDIPFLKLKETVIHLSDYGEFTSDEVVRLRNDSTLQIIGETGAVINSNKCWVVSHAFCESISVPDFEYLILWICSSYPTYRSYLMILIAAEITRRSLEGAMALTEEWIVSEFSGIVSELNQVLDELENDYLGALVTKAMPGMIVTFCNQKLESIQRETGLDFNAWNKNLFGISGNNEGVFQAILSKQIFKNVQFVSRQVENHVLTKIVDLNTDLSIRVDRLVFFPPLDAEEFDEGNLTMQPSSVWRKRQYIYSSIPLWEKDKIKSVTIEDIHKSFCQHPIPWIMIQLGIAQHTQELFGDQTDNLQIQVKRDANDQIFDCFIIFGDQIRRSFSEYLNHMLIALGFRLVLPFGNIPKHRFNSLIGALIHFDIFNLNSQEQLSLSENFIATLYEKAFRMQMLKKPKPYRQTLIRILRGTQ